MNKIIPAFILSVLYFSYPAIHTFAQELLPPQSVEAIDTPSDSGGSYCLIWPVAPGENETIFYVISTSGNPNGPFQKAGEINSLKNYQSDNPAYFGFAQSNKQNHYFEIPVPIDDAGNPRPWYGKVSMVQDSTIVDFGGVVTATPKQNWFKYTKLNNLVIVILLFGFIYFFIERAKKNPNLFIRRIPGLEAIDDAIGRATEMGKPILYLTGAYEISEVSTIASVNILSHVAKKVAAYDSRIIVPCRFSIAMTVCQEVVRESYLNIGRPDAFNVNDIHYVTEDQFGFTAAVDGIMVREKPAANFFLGTFAAESIILAETGASTGAIQIAGTDSTYQLPFFVVSCDYTLIGEELYAASAYLSREPKLLGSLRGQDAGKILIVASLIIGSILVALYYAIPNDWFLMIQHFYTVL